MSFACGDYDRVRALRDGTVRAAGLALRFLVLPPREIFDRALRNAEFDVCELSLGNYVAAVARGTSAYVAVPVFPSRYFRHSAAYVNVHAGVDRPEDLRGKRIGIGEYQMTALIWMRAFLESDHGVRPTDVTWVVGGIDRPQRYDRMTLELPGDLRIEQAPEGATLEAMLERGEIDALFSPSRPKALGARTTVRRLFADHRSVERDYFQRTGIFPIMHTLGIRRDIYARDPWVAQSLFVALVEAKRRAMDALLDAPALPVTLPWALAEAEDAGALMGSDWWPYGVAENLPTLEAFLEASHRQGITDRRLAVSELFAKETAARPAR